MRSHLRDATPRAETQAQDEMASLHAVVMLGSFMHAAPDPAKTAELSAGGLVALCRLPLAAVAWYAEPQDGTLRVTGRSAGEQSIRPGIAGALRDLCASFSMFRPTWLGSAQLPGSLRTAGIEVLFALPLRVSTECLGFLVVGGSHGSIPPDLTLIQALAAQTSTALYVARLQESEAARLRELSQLAGVLREQGEQLSRALRLQEELLDLVLCGKDPWAIVEHLGRQICAPVWLLDADQRTIAHATGGHTRPARLPRESELRRVLGAPHPDCEPRSVEMATGHGIQRFLVQNVSTDRETFGYLVVGSTELGPVDHATFQCGRLVLALRLLIERSVVEAEERAGRHLLQDVLLHRGGGLTSAALAAQLGYEEDGPAAVLAIRTPLPAGGGARLESAGRRATAAVREELRAGHRGLVGVIGEDIIAIVRPETAEQHVEHVLRRVVAAVPELQISIGISDTRSGLSDLEPAYREALMAVTLAQRCPGRRLRFADLGLHRMLFDVAHADRVEEHVERWIGPLLRYDAAHRTRLVETLGRFLAGDRQQEIAQGLSIHLSTLKYRLRRIREILNVDFTHADVRFNIELALRLAEAMRTIRDDGHAGPARHG
jgi:hypothetical protein